MIRREPRPLNRQPRKLTIPAVPAATILSVVVLAVASQLTPCQRPIRATGACVQETDLAGLCMAVVDDAQMEETSAEVEQVYQAEALKMWRAIVGYAGDSEIANDAVSEAFARALHHRDSIHDLRAWTWRVAFRVAAAELRGRKRHDEGSPLDAVEPSAEAADLVAALRRLSERQRLALVLHDYADRPTAEVAAILGCSTATVHVHLSRGRKRLRALLEVRDA